jgi:hypothetical protein
MRRTLCSAALAWLAWTGSALPAAASPEPAPAPVQVVAPAAGTVLQAGSLAELEWTPLATFEDLAGVKEWEAFLSLDGGAHYTVRITPHLDVDLHRVLWRVPAVMTSDARLLLRLGDERQETPFEIPGSFVIAGPAVAGLDLEPARVVLGRGEPARPGEPGVVAWAEGSRRGGPVRQVVAVDPSTFRPGTSIAESRGEAAVVAPAGPEPDPPTPAGGSRPSPPRGQRTADPALTAQAHSHPVPILLQTQRRNE